MRLRKLRGLYIGALAGAVIWHLTGLDFIRGAYAGEVSSAWVVLSVLASCPLVVAVALARGVFRNSRLPMSVELPVVWLAIEYARMYFIALFTEVPFPYMQLGTLVQSAHLVQVADLGGTWAVTWIVASVNGALFDGLTGVWLWRKDPTARRRAYFSVSIAATLLGAAWLYGAWRLSQTTASDGPVLALVPGSIGRETDEQDPQALIAKIHAGVANQRPALLVWAEGACSFPIVTEWLSAADADSDDPSLTLRASSGLAKNGENSSLTHRVRSGRAEKGKNPSLALRASDELVAGTVQANPRPRWKDDASMARLGALSKQFGAAVLVGCRREEIVPGDPLARMYNSLALGTPQQGFQGCYDKVYLVPWREFRPMVALTFGLLPEPPSDRAYAGPFRAGRLGAPFTLSVHHGTYRFATAICCEVFYSPLHRGSMSNAPEDERPEFFVGAANESAFTDSQYARLSFDAQRLRAIECRRAYARIATRGISAIVDGNGQVVASEEMTANSKPLAARVPIDRRFSFYVAWGDWLPIGCCAAITMFGVSGLLRRARPRGSPADAQRVA